MRILTIGGYGFTERAFVDKLKEAKVDAFVDVRQRRGMRGAKYAFLNSVRLQQLLHEVGISYVHALDLAPTTKVRDSQKLEDRDRGTTKRHRLHLSPIFCDGYRSEVLAVFDSDRLKLALGTADTIALFCVEQEPTACHRSLAAEHLVRSFEVRQPVEHLHP